VLTEIRKTVTDHTYTTPKPAAGKKDCPGKIKKGKPTTKEQPSAVKKKPVDAPKTESEVKKERIDSVEIEVLDEVACKVTTRKMLACKVDGCAHSYNYSSGLKDHMRREHGAAKLPCRVPTCPATFTTHRTLGSHMKKEHGAAKECLEVACTDDESPTGDKDKEEGKLLGKRRHCEKEEEGGRMNEVQKVQKVQRQWEKEREEELGDDMSQEGIFM